MGRLELIYTCVSNQVKVLEKSGEAEQLPERLRKYGSEGSKNAYCYRLEADEVASRLEALTADAIELYEISEQMCGGEEEHAKLWRVVDWCELHMNGSYTVHIRYTWSRSREARLKRRTGSARAA
jgi:hypothetical protein